MPAPKIAIIGAGPAGLTLARLLQQNSIPTTIYEGEACRETRNQGGTLDLHRDAGQLALKEAGLFAEFAKHARPEGDCMKLISYDGAVLWDENEQPGRPEDLSDRPEIDRVLLRQILLDSLDEGTIVWGKRVERVVKEGTKGKHAIYFKDGSSVNDIDLVVGADGAWSKVRPLLTDEKPFYSSISCVELWANDVETSNPWLSKYVGNGSCFMFDEGRALLCQRQGNGSIRSYAAVRQTENWIEECGIDFKAPDARQRVADEYFKDCGEDVKRAIVESKDELVPRKLYMLPVGIKWESQPGITILGDAAHLMTPFAGVGVNVAMADALGLAKALIARKDSLTAKVFSDGHNIAVAIKEYEQEMFVRGEKNARKTAKNLENHFSKGGSEQMASMFRKFHEMREQAADEAAGKTA